MWRLHLSCQIFQQNIITNRFHTEKAQGDSVISYYIIISRDLMVQLGLKTDFGNQIIEWGKTLIPTKDPGIFLVQSYLTKHEIQEGVM